MPSGRFSGYGACPTCGSQAKQYNADPATLVCTKAVCAKETQFKLGSSLLVGWATCATCAKLAAVYASPDPDLAGEMYCLCGAESSITAVNLKKPPIG